MTDGIESSLKEAQVAARGKDVSIDGGANSGQQLMKPELLDETQTRKAPFLLGSYE